MWLYKAKLSLSTLSKAIQLCVVRVLKESSVVYYFVERGQKEGDFVIILL